ncbi:MAG: winged helix-turn-helix domain-containing protein, partial [Anaerolineales bacterium]
PEEKETYRFGANEINFLTFEAQAGDRTINLTEKECMLMKLLAERKNQVVSREEILERVWGYRFSTSSRTIDNFIVRLRRYFEPDPKKIAEDITIEHGDGVVSGRVVRRGEEILRDKYLYPQLSQLRKLLGYNP